MRGGDRSEQEPASSATKVDGAMRCHCGSLLARLVPRGVEIKCRRCKRRVVIPLRRHAVEASGGAMSDWLRVEFGDTGNIPRQVESRRTSTMRFGSQGGFWSHLIAGVIRSTCLISSIDSLQCTSTKRLIAPGLAHLGVNDEFNHMHQRQTILLIS
jgi:hypothetical protein